jgi:hypothetical protein
MSKTVKEVLSNKNQYSKATYDMKHRSDGRLPARQKPASAGDKVIHNDHIVDSGQYNLRHTHDHLKELVFDYERLKEKPEEAARIQHQAMVLLNPIWKGMHLKLEEC